MVPTHSPLPRLSPPERVGNRSRLEAALLRLEDRRSLPAAQTTDRRALPRRDSRCAVSVYCRVDDRPVNPQQIDWLLHSTRLKGELLDISMNSASFLLSEPLDRGENICLRLSNPRLDKHVDTVADVLRTSAEEKDRWKIICRFRRNLTFEQIHEFSKSLLETTVV